MPTATAAAAAMPKFLRRCLRCSSRHGSRFIRGMLLEAPQRQAEGREQRGGILHHALRFRFGRNFHLPERIAAHRVDADPARDEVVYARDVGAAAADDDLIGLLPAAAGGEEELQRAAD